MLKCEYPREHGGDHQQEEDQLIGVLTKCAADLVRVVAAEEPRHVDQGHHGQLHDEQRHQQPRDGERRTRRPDPVDGPVEEERPQEAVDEDEHGTQLHPGRIRDRGDDA